MGGAVPASLSRELTEIRQEGTRFRPSKLYRAGVLGRDGRGRDLAGRSAG